MMPIADCSNGPRKPRIAATLSAITLFALLGCGGTGGTLVTELPPTSEQNTAPAISGTPGTAVVPGQAYSFSPQATDANGDPITFEITNQPSWANFDAATGLLAGMPGEADVGVYSNVIISATDGRARSVLPAFSINVSAVGIGNAALAWTPPTNRTDGSQLTDLAGYRIYYGNAPGLYLHTINVSAPGVTSYQVDNLGSGTWYFAVTAVDSTGGESPLSNAASKVIG